MSSAIHSFYNSDFNRVKIAPYKIVERLFPIPQVVKDYLTIQDLDNGIIEHIEAGNFAKEHSDLRLQAESKIQTEISSNLLKYEINGSIDLESPSYVIEFKFGKAEPILRYSYLIQLITYMYATRKHGILCYTNYITGKSALWVFDTSSISTIMAIIMSFYELRPHYTDEQWYYKKQELQDILAVWVGHAISVKNTKFEKVWRKYASEKDWEVVRY